MELSPGLYKWFVRPGWFSDTYINNTLKNEFDFKNKKVLDFGCGIGSGCSIFDPNNYLGIDCDQKRIFYARNFYPTHNFAVVKDCRIPVLKDSIDYILVISVLHHIPKDELPSYLFEFSRILRPEGKVIVNEPCFFENYTFSNLFMRCFDCGKHIQTKDEYVKIFRKHCYEVKIHKQYNQLYCYNKLFFSAIPTTQFH